MSRIQASVNAVSLNSWARKRAFSIIDRRSEGDFLSCSRCDKISRAEPARKKSRSDFFSAKKTESKSTIAGTPASQALNSLVAGFHCGCMDKKLRTAKTASVLV